MPTRKTIHQYQIPAKAPNGMFWKFDCTWIQKLTYQNCWEGDRGDGHGCTIWDKLLNNKCYDVGAIRC